MPSSKGPTPTDLYAVAARAAMPPPKLSVSEWADNNRVLSGESAAEPGRWRTSRTPYSKEPMDCFSDPGVETVACMWASQLGKTEIILNVIGYFIDCDPCPILWVEPTLPLARDYSITRLSPMIDNSPALNGKVRKPKSREPGTNTLQKTFPGGVLKMVGAQSPTDLAGRPIRVVIQDEQDRYTSTSEGDPEDLADKRTTNFWNRKKGKFSSPGRKGVSRAEANYLAGDQREWWVPCPSCGKHQVLKWSGVVWDKVLDEEGRPVKGPDGHSIHLPETAMYACEHCGDLWNDGMRLNAISRGEWRANKPFKGAASFRLNSLNSPWVMLKDKVDEFIKATKSIRKMEVFVNTVLAETFEETGEVVDDGELIKRVEPYSGVPRWVAILTTAVDVQKDRLELEILGWGRDEESWQIDYRVIYGNPDQPEIWKELDSFLTQHYETDDGRVLNIRAVAVDSGHKADKVMEFCRPRWGRKVWPIKGDAKGLDAPIWPAGYSRGKYGKLFSINVDAAKKAVKDYLAITEPGPGYCHFPDCRTRAYFEQFAAEELVTRFKFGHPKKQWQQKAGRRNEALDIRGYNIAVLKGLIRQGLNLNRECERIEHLNLASKNQKTQTRTPPPVPGSMTPPAWPGAVRASNPWLNA